MLACPWPSEMVEVLGSPLKLFSLIKVTEATAHKYGAS